MERQSDKHGPRLDEEMQLETESLERGAAPEPRAQESREKEPPADGEPTPDDRVRAGAGMEAPDGLTPQEVEWRQEIARHIEGAVFPAERDEIIESARSMGATEQVLAALHGLPSRRFEAFPEVWEAIGGRREGTRAEHNV